MIFYFNLNPLISYEKHSDFCCFLISITLTVQSGTYYVAPWGDDNQPGTYDAPWQTIRKGADELHPGDTLIRELFPLLF